MGLFSFLEKPFRTGATQAAKQGKALGEQTLAEQVALKTEVGDIYQPTMQAGQEAFQGLTDFYNGDQQAIVNQAQASPFMDQMVESGESVVARNAQMTGGFRSGTTQENLVENKQNILMQLVNQMLQGKQAISAAGTNATDAYTTAMQNIQAGVGGTRGQIAGVDINKAAGKQNLFSGIIGGASQALGSYLGAPASPAGGG